jgi:hypothetical protein
MLLMKLADPTDVVLSNPNFNKFICDRFVKTKFMRSKCVFSAPNFFKYVGKWKLWFFAKCALNLK